MPRRKQYSDQSEDYDDDDSENEKVQIRKPKIQRIDKFKNLKKIVINVSMTQYPVVSQVAEELGWKIQTSHQAGDWDIFWTDFSIDPDILIRMHLFQKINHFPGIQTLARKNLLGANLTNMGKLYPNQYNFFPLTWMLPQQYAQFRQYYQAKQKGKTRTYIVKPEADCQGRGIFLTRKIEEMQTGKHYVVQRYLARPYLLDGLKFDFRIYILLAGTSPLRLYMYDQGLARLATQLYTQPMNVNLDKLCMHLTNYAINKFNPKFIFNTNSSNMGIGHKRSLGCTYKQLEKAGLDIKILKQKIKDMIIKTVISGLPLMSHQYRCSQPQDYTGNMCFHVLGFDVMLNSKGDPFVIQVNHTPSFTTDTPLDQKIKNNLIRDTLVLMNINIKQKNQLFNRCKQYNTQRLLTGKRHIYQGEDREVKIKEAQQIRDKYQEKHMGGYQKIYPVDDVQKMQKYEQMIAASMNIYMEQNQTVRNRLQQRQLKKMMKTDAKANKKDRIKAKNQNQTLQESQKTPSAPPFANQSISFLEKEDNKAKHMPGSSPLIQVSFSPQLKKKITQKSDHRESGLLSETRVIKVNQIRNGFRQKPEKISCITTDKADKEDTKSSPLKKPISRDLKSTKSRMNHQGSQLRKSQKNQTPAELPNIDNGSSISDNFITSQYSQKKHKERPFHAKVILRSAPKQAKLIENIQKNFKQVGDKKTFISNNGNYIMPKIFYLNVDAERKDQLNFLTLGKKVQSLNCEQA